MLELQNINHGFLSYSGLTTWDECPYRFKLKYVDKIDFDDSNIYTFYGNSMHHTLEQHINDYNKKDFVDKCAKTFEQFYLENWKDSFIQNKKWLNEDSKLLFLNNGKQQISKQFPEIKTIFHNMFGKKFSIKYKEAEAISVCFDTAKIKSFIDLIIEDVNGKNHIIDYKFVKEIKKLKPLAPIKAHQLNLYQTNTINSGLVGNIGSTNLMIFSKKIKEPVTMVNSVRDSGATMQQTEQWLKNVVWGIKQEISFVNKGPNCFFCSLHKTEYCP